MSRETGGVSKPKRTADGGSGLPGLKRPKGLLGDRVGSGGFKKSQDKVEMFSQRPGKSLGNGDREFTLKVGGSRGADGGDKRRPPRQSGGAGGEEKRERRGVKALGLTKEQKPGRFYKK
jgi:hypothetical protein